ncbi:MAG: hypothetical protein PCFJNLEI_02229 [Verrucomicrobiae bacterium]|nr:hypothetical protein [Verrucomicrobiae bacterium]
MKSIQPSRHVVGTLRESSTAPPKHFKRISSQTVSFLILAFLALPFASLFAADWYASPTGTSSGAGTLASPWDLKTALTRNGTIKAGDTLWLRGGSHLVGGKSFRYNCYLAGTAAAPITVRNYNGERAIVDGPILHTGGGYVRWWGLEFTTTITANRRATQTGSWPTDFWITNGLGAPNEDYAISGLHNAVPGNKVINCHFHDCIGGGVGNDGVKAGGMEVYGNLIQYNGWVAPDRTHGHGMYLQNTITNPTLAVTDNLMFNNANHGGQFYGTDDANNFQITGNIFANNGSVFTNDVTVGRNVLVGSGVVTRNNTFSQNYIWRSIGDRAAGQAADHFPGYTGGTIGWTVKSNIVVGTSQFKLASDTAFTGNRYYGTNQWATGSASSFPGNTYALSRPTTGLDVIIRPNAYEANRSHMIIYNWAGASSITVNVSSVSAPGDILTLRNAQNYHGDILTLTNVNGSIIIPLTGRTVAAPIDTVNSPKPASTFPYFGVFIVIKSSGGTGNTPPTITPPSNQSLNANTSTGPLAVTVGDSQTAAGSLTLSASSSNTSLVPNSGITFGGSGSSRTVTVTPAANQSGTATITLTVSDGSLSANTSFTVTVNTVNTAPTITNPGNRTTSANTSIGPLTITVADSQTAAGSLTLSASSSNTSVVPNSGIALGGSGSSRTVTVTPAANQSGTATITLTVSDGSLSANASFTVTVNAVNTAPTITNPGDRSINANTSTGPLAITIGDSQTAAASLTLSADSSNTSLVPTSGITFGGSGANRTVTITPAANQSGTATITLTVSDGSLTSFISFFVVVSAGNTSPSISGLSNQTVNTNTTVGPLNLTIGDSETSAGSLTLTASSSNTSLVPNNAIIIGGSGSSRTVTINPAANQTGTATIALTVSDGSLTASTSFTITVNAAAPPNTPPTISSVANQSINANTSAGPLAITIGDAQTAAGSLTLTANSSNTSLIPNNAITFGGSGANRTVTVTPAANQTGTATITLTVSDGSLNISTVFTVTVNAVNTAPTITGLGAQSIDANTTLGPLAVSVADSQTAAGSLTLTASSSNTSLVPNSGITLGGSAGNRTITVTPAANQTGTATITLTVSDGNLSASTAFILTVNSTNPDDAPPELTRIANQTVSTNSTAGPLPFMVSDASNSPDNLTITVSSSNTDLVPNNSIVLAGSGHYRTVAATPSSQRSGKTTITVRAADGNQASTTSFTLDVVAPVTNRPPTITSLSAQSIQANTSLLHLPFTIADDRTKASRLSLGRTSSNPALIPTGNISFSGKGNIRTVSLTPIYGQTGTAIITLSVKDGFFTTFTSFQVTVLPPGETSGGGNTTPAPAVAVNSWTEVAGLPIVVAGDPTTFRFKGTTLPSGSTTYQWNFGDSNTSTLGQPTHAYADCGTYRVAASRNDSLGTQIANRNISIPCQMEIPLLQLKSDFARPSADSAKLTAILPLDPKFIPEGQPLSLSIGNNIVSFTLDAKGRAASPAGRCRLTFNQTTQTWQLVISLNKSTWQDAWTNFGMTNVTNPGSTIKMPVIVVVNNEAFAAEKLLTYVAAINTFGSAK